MWCVVCSSIVHPLKGFEPLAAVLEGFRAPSGAQSLKRTAMDFLGLLYEDFAEIKLWIVCLKLSGHSLMIVHGPKHSSISCQVGLAPCTPERTNFP